MIEPIAIILVCLMFGAVVLAVVLSGGGNQCTKCMYNESHDMCDNDPRKDMKDKDINNDYM